MILMILKGSNMIKRFIAVLIINIFLLEQVYASSVFSSSDGSYNINTSVPKYDNQYYKQIQLENSNLNDEYAEEDHYNFYETEYLNYGTSYDSSSTPCDDSYQHINNSLNNVSSESQYNNYIYASNDEEDVKDYQTITEHEATTIMKEGKAKEQKINTTIGVATIILGVGAAVAGALLFGDDEDDKHKKRHRHHRD